MRPWARRSRLRQRLQFTNGRFEINGIVCIRRRVPGLREVEFPDDLWKTHARRVCRELFAQRREVDRPRAAKGFEHNAVFLVPPAMVLQGLKGGAE